MTSSTPSTPPDLPSLVTSLSSPSAARLKALYAFTSAQQQTNPSGYQANVAWWTQTLEDGLREGLVGRTGPSSAAGDVRDRLILHANEDALLQSLEWPGVGRPKGVGGVLSRALASDPRSQLGTKPLLVAASRFTSSCYTPIDPPASASTGISLTGLAAKPLWWLLGKVNPFGGGGGANEASVSTESEQACWKKIKAAGGDFVWTPLLRDAADKAIAHLAAHPPTTNSARLLTPEIFQKTYSRYCSPSRYDTAPPLSLADCKILLKYLAVDRDVLIMNKQGEVYKVADPSAEEEEVTEADKGTIAVMSTLSRVEQQIELSEREINTATHKAKHYLAIDQKPTALTYLRSKKELEAQLNKRINVAEQLKTVLRSIDTAHGDVEIMRAYELSATTLKSVLAHPSLQKESVDATTDALADVMSDAHDIDQAVQLGGQLALEAGGHVEPDLGELESELAALMAEPEVKAVDVPISSKPPAQASTSASEATANAQSPSSQSDWKRVHDEAQLREQDERARAAAERLQKEKRLLAAE